MLCHVNLVIHLSLRNRQSGELIVLSVHKVRKPLNFVIFSG